jgi:excisionase family DNA binding protein
LQSRCRECAARANKERRTRLDEFGTRDVITVADAAEILGVRKRDVRRLADQGKISSIDVGTGKHTHLRVSRPDVLAWKEASQLAEDLSKLGNPEPVEEQKVASGEPQSPLKLTTSDSIWSAIGRLSAEVLKLHGAALVDPETFEKFADPIRAAYNNLVDAMEAER